MEDRPQKAHRPAQSGNKAERKALKKGKGKSQNGGYNEKVCFALRNFMKLTSRKGIRCKVWSQSRATRAQKCREGAIQVTRASCKSNTR
jgi:hypothetical protein